MILFVVATPIGNLEDMSFRAIATLQQSDFVYAEDSRRAKKLFEKFSINTSLRTFYEGVEEERANEILTLLKSGKNISLISDAGTPLISDPGYKLIRDALNEGIKVEAVPGPSALLTALVSSGLPTDQFFFVGFLPKKPGKQKEIINQINDLTKKRPTTIIFFESPYRVRKTITLLAQSFPNKTMVIARELTKIHEEILRGRAKDLASAKFNEKGEFTLLLY